MEKQILADDQISDQHNDQKVILVCINARWSPRPSWCDKEKRTVTRTCRGTGLVEGRKYTALGTLVDEGGNPCYFIAEIKPEHQQRKLCERFVKIKTK